MKADHVLDVKGLACPMPIIKIKKGVKDIGVGEVLEIHATDKGLVADLAAWSQSSGHELMDQKEADGIFTFMIQKG